MGVKYFDSIAEAYVCRHRKNVDVRDLEWCIREATDTWFLETVEEFVGYVLAMYDACVWGKSVEKTW